MPKNKQTIGRFFTSCFHRKKWPIAALAAILILAGATALILIKNDNVLSPARAADNASLKSAAVPFLQKNEKTGVPIAMEYAGQTYYYLPIEIKKKISKNFAGAMLDADGEAVRD